MIAIGRQHTNVLVRSSRGLASDTEMDPDDGRRDGSDTFGDGIASFRARGSRKTMISTHSQHAPLERGKARYVVVR